MNSTSTWKATVLPSLNRFIEKTGKLPACITASFAFYIAFFSGERLTEDALIGLRGEEEYQIKDDRFVLEFYEAHKNDSAAELAHAVCTNESFWGEDLSKLDGFETAVAKYLEEIRTLGSYEVMKHCLEAVK